MTAPRQPTDQALRQGEAGRYPHQFEPFEPDTQPGQAEPLGDGAMPLAQSLEKLNAQLRESEERYRLLFESLDEGYCVIEKVGGEAGELLDFRYVETNPAFAAQTGLSDVIGKSLRQVLPDEFEERIRTYEAVQRTGVAVRFQRQFPNQNRLLELHACRVADKPQGRVAIYLQDITERTRAQAALRESEAFSHSIVKSSLDCIKVLDLEGNLLSMHSGQELLGIEDLQPFLNKSWIDFWQGTDDRRAAQAAVAAAAAGGAGSFVGFFRTLHGDAKWWDVAISPILDANGKPARLLAVSRDVTQRQQATDVLRQRTVQFETLLNDAPLGVYLIDADFRIRQVNPTALPAFGNIPELIGRDFAAVMHILWPSAQADEAVKQFRHTLETGEACFVPEMIEKRADRQTMEYYEWQINRILLPDGRHGVVCYFRDISERVLAQQKIRDSEERYRGLFNSIDEGFAILEIIFDEEEQAVDYRFLEVNPAFGKQTGVPDATGKRIREITPDQQAPALEIYSQVLLTGEPVRFVNEAKAMGRYFDVYASRLGGPESRKIAVVFSNITERQEAEEALRKSESRFRALVMASSDLMCRLSPDWREMHHIYDKNLVVNSEVSNANWLEYYVHRDDQPRLLALVNEAIRTKSLFEMEHRVRLVDGEWGWMLSRAVPLLDASGEILEWFGTGSDVTEKKLAEQALRESEERYHSLFNSIDEGFCLIEMIFDAHDKAIDYRFLEVNPAFERQTGMLAVTGKRMRELVPHLEEYWFETYGKVALTGEAIRFVSEAKALGERWFDVYAFPYGGRKNGKVALLFNDMSERNNAQKALGESEERLRLAAEAAHFGMYDRDLGGAYFHDSVQIKHMLGYEPDAPLSHSQVMSHIHPDDQPAGLAAFLRACDPAGDGQIAVEQRIVRRDGTERWISSVGRVLFEDGVPKRSIGFWVDITERSRLARKTLEQAQALADLDRRKDEFLAMLGHELRNPLAAIANAAQLLRRQQNEAPLQQQARQVIERQVGQLKHLVDDLLEVSRITSGSVRLRQERISLSGVVERAVETAQPLIAQHQHALTVSLPSQPVFLHADAARLEQVLVNLLNNAAKYTNDGGRIWLSVEHEGEAAVIKVRDNGIGIAAELLPRIFDLFTQAERSLDRSQGGLGIGLSLVQQLVELHGGTVKAESVMGQGSEFVVRLALMQPALSAAAPALDTAQPSDKAVTCCRVLVVDDNVDAAEGLALLLEMSGHQVKLAYDGPSAVQVATSYRPDVVLLDIGLPGLDGFGVAQQIRQQDALKHVVLVALTGYGQDTDRQRSQAAGFDYHLVKPVDFDEVEKILLAVWQKVRS